MTPHPRPPAIPSALASAAMLAVALAALAPAPAIAQQAFSVAASSVIKPPLPTPPVNPDAGPAAFLVAARTAVERARYGEAQEALERGETRLLLDRASTATTAAFPDRQRVVADVAAARRATIARDRPAALAAIDDALAALQAPLLPPAVLPPQIAAAPLPPPASGPIPLSPPSAYAPPPYAVAPYALAPVAPSPPVLPGPPPETYAMLPGHWQLDGARYVWVPPDTTLRRVADTAVIPNRYVWRDGRWVFEPQHTVTP